MNAAAVIGWYGPLVDLRNAFAHVDDFVQLVVFIQRCHPYQRQKGSKGMVLQGIDFQMGDDTMTNFSGRVWQKYLVPMIVSGNVVLLQNVKIMRYRDTIEVVTKEMSSILVLVHHYDLNSSKAIHDLISHCRGAMIKEKLTKVIKWVQKTESLLQNVQKVILCQGFEPKISMKNWKYCEKKSSMNCNSVIEVSQLRDSCTVIFFACIGEICKYDNQIKLGRQLFSVGENAKIIEDFICFGCSLCGSPLISSYTTDLSATSFYCQKSYDHVHVACSIYRPFLLNVYDQFERLPILVKNKAAEILFGNISAEKVTKCFEIKKKDEFRELNLNYTKIVGSSHTKDLLPTETVNENKKHAKNTSLPDSDTEPRRRTPDFHGIWLILVKSLLLKDENSCLRFEVVVDTDKDELTGRYELLSLTIPCHREE